VPAEFTIQLSRPLRRIAVEPLPPGDMSPFAQPSGCGPNSIRAQTPEAAPSDVIQPDQDCEALQHVLQALGLAAKTLTQERLHCVEQAKRLAIDLACEIASHLVHAKIKRDDYPLEEIVGLTVRELSSRRGAEVSVRLNPQDKALLERRLGPELESFCKNGGFMPVSDSSIARGCCVADTEHAGATYRWDAALETVRTRLREAVGHA
jgi:flagellar biosynthesis/type III secretory pathway protein FliH